MFPFTGSLTHNHDSLNSDWGIILLSLTHYVPLTTGSLTHSHSLSLSDSLNFHGDYKVGEFLSFFLLIVSFEKILKLSDAIRDFQRPVILLSSVLTSSLIKHVRRS